MYNSDPLVLSENLKQIKACAPILVLFLLKMYVLLFFSEIEQFKEIIESLILL